MSHPEDVQSQLETLQQRLSTLTALHAGCDTRIRELREQNAMLRQLTAASRMLARSIDRENVLTAIEEIVVTMIGGEELAIFDIDYVEQCFRVARARGVDATSPRVARAMDRFGDVMSSGRTLVAPALGADLRDARGELTAAVPLSLEGCVTGVVAIFRLAERKRAFEPVDHKLFEILACQAAMALHSVKFEQLRPTVRPPRPRDPQDDERS
jgi:GAF domain-containing protein